MENINTLSNLEIAVAQYGRLGATAIPSMIGNNYSMWLHSYRLLASKEALERFVLPTRVQNPVSSEIADALACVTWDKYFGHTNWPGNNKANYIAIGISSGFLVPYQPIVYMSFYTKNGIISKNSLLETSFSFTNATNYIEEEINNISWNIND